MDAFRHLSRDTRDYWAKRKIERIQVKDFEEYARRGEPVIITDCVRGWRAFRKWDERYLRETIGSDTLVHVNGTPDGVGDAVIEGSKVGGAVFVLPEERKMPFGTFLERTTTSDSSRKDVDAVFYLSHQNDNFRQQFSMLSEDVPRSIPWAENVFGTLDAVNLWIGSMRSRSSTCRPPPCIFCDCVL